MESKIYGSPFDNDDNYYCATCGEPFDAVETDNDPDCANCVIAAMDHEERVATIRAMICALNPSQVAEILRDIKGL